MKHINFAKLTLAVAAVLVISSFAAAQKPLTIDSFSSGFYTKTLTQGSGYYTQTGNMAGGSRDVYLGVCGDPCTANPFGQPVTFQVKKAANGEPNALIFDTGYKANGNLQVIYGEGGNMNLNLSPYDRFRLYFDGADQGINFDMIVYTDGNYSSTGCNFNDPGLLTNFTLEVPFEYITGDADFTDITAVGFSFDVAQGSGGEDWAVTYIEAVNGTIGGNSNIICGGPQN